MTLRQQAPNFFPRRINQYTPAMSYAADIVHGGVSPFTLGSPAVADPNGILATKSATNSAQAYTSADFATTFDGSATSLTGTVGMMDAPYGRNVTLVGTAGSDHVVTITGKDYLGQVMTEDLTLSAALTITGAKAFKYIDAVDVATGATGDTFDMGWGTRLGLPYRFSRIEYVMEGGVFAPTALELHLSEVDSVVLSGANAASFIAPFDGFVTGWDAEVTTAVVTAAAVMDAIIAGTGVPALDGIVPVLAASAGLLAGVRTGNNVAAQAVSQGDIFTLTSSAAPSAGAADFQARFARPQGGYQIPDATDPATATTRDTRGTYEAFSTLDAATEIIVYMRGDNEINAGGNGGLHGIAQV